MSKSFIVSLLVITSSIGSHVAAQSTEQEVLKAEQTRLEARRKADASTLTGLSADDVLVVGPSGQLVDKNGVSALPAVPKIALRDLKTRMFGDVAVLTGIQSGVGATSAQEQRFTRVWQRRNGQWLNVFSQVTSIGSSEPAPAVTPPKQVPQTVWPKGSSADETAVLDVQRRIDEVFARKDTTAYATLTAANWVRLNRDGSETSRQEFLKTVAGTPELKRVVPNHSEFRVRTYGPIAVVVYRAETAAGADLRRSRVFVKEGATWKQLVSQETNIAQQ